MRILDLFCCAGGASRGYADVGFEVVGVDIAPQPRYPYAFHKDDALACLRYHRAGLETFDLIHASPPCQERSTLTRGTNRANGWGREHEQLVPQVRELLDATGIPYVIEQPTGHGGLIRRDVTLCGDMFRGDRPPPWVQRHRDFELGGWAAEQPVHVRHTGYVRGMRHGVYRDGPYVAAYGSGGGKATVTEMRAAMGIDWTDVREELTEAILPAYTRWIGEQFKIFLARASHNMPSGQVAA